jgi:molybdate transport system substrate-binding protein
VGPRSLIRAAVAFALLAACSSDVNNVTESVTVFAAASLTDSFNDIHPDGVSVRYSFGGSGALVTQIQQGAPADVIATADIASMKKLTDAGLVETPTTFARNKLEMLVAPGNPKGITTVADLARTDIKFVTEDDTVPAGKYAAQILQAARVTAHPVSKELDVKAAVAKVTSGEADVTVVYATDVKAVGTKGQGVPIPDAQNVVAEYPIAIVKGTKSHAAASVFVADVVNGAGHNALLRRGFLPAT